MMMMMMIAISKECKCSFQLAVIKFNFTTKVFPHLKKFPIFFYEKNQLKRKKKYHSFLTSFKDLQLISLGRN